MGLGAELMLSRVLFFSSILNLGLKLPAVSSSRIKCHLIRSRAQNPRSHADRLHSESGVFGVWGSTSTRICATRCGHWSVRTVRAHHYPAPYWIPRSRN
ncbi:hypothetical protein B0H10DRAFT_2138377 [Mycena sp. CBHHK59/15]|nr:hypothetical protein B0H10DRAFT_2138377 [Mycena sp. CBHHK59/15]